MSDGVGNPGGQGQSPAPAVPLPGFLKDSNCCAGCFLTLMLPILKNPIILTIKKKKKKDCTASLSCYDLLLG